MEEISVPKNNLFQLHLSRPNSNISSTKLKGVVPQQNGHWGAQIYANHQRVWLGTFKTEKEAAMAYDSAAIRLRRGDSHRNLPWNKLTEKEPEFQTQYSTESLLNMIKDGSYPYKFADFLRTQAGRGGIEVGINIVTLPNNLEPLCRLLFQKELTPSDVSKLNRLVIPKNYAVKYFPAILDNNGKKEHGSPVEDTELAFCDRFMRSWKFRYCYWRSSQSFVFTKGWNRFVKEMNLKAKDIVAFYVCEDKGGRKAGQIFSMIDVVYTRGESSGGLIEGAANQDVEMQVESQLNEGEKIDSNGSEDLQENRKESGLKPVHNEENKGVRLFGVQIS